MKTYWIALTVEGKKQDGDVGYYAHAWQVSECDNLKTVMERLKPAFAHIYPTKKKACEVVRFWNDGYRANGVNLYPEF